MNSDREFQEELRKLPCQGSGSLLAVARRRMLAHVRLFGVDRLWNTVPFPGSTMVKDILTRFSVRTPTERSGFNTQG